jgi:hypothetical protein
MKKKVNCNFSAVNIFPFLVIKTVDPDPHPDPHGPKMPDPH